MPLTIGPACCRFTGEIEKSGKFSQPQTLNQNNSWDWQLYSVHSRRGYQCGTDVGKIHTIREMIVIQNLSNQPNIAFLLAQTNRVVRFTLVKFLEIKLPVLFKKRKTKRIKRWGFSSLF